MELLGKRKYSYKIKNRILEVARVRETDEYWYKQGFELGVFVLTGSFFGFPAHRDGDVIVAAGVKLEGFIACIFG